jgi:SAM-dependent methyltransferase
VLPAPRFLDVGCGCGFLAACAATLVGRQGSVVGVDIKAAAIQLSQDNIDRLRATSSRCESPQNSPCMAAAACITTTVCCWLFVWVHVLVIEGSHPRLTVLACSCMCSYASSACPVALLQHNVFIPSAKLKGKFNKVMELPITLINTVTVCSQLSRMHETAGLPRTL